MTKDTAPTQHPALDVIDKEIASWEAERHTAEAAKFKAEQRISECVGRINDASDLKARIAATLGAAPAKPPAKPRAKRRTPEQIAADKAAKDAARDKTIEAAAPLVPQGTAVDPHAIPVHLRRAQPSAGA